jgi:DNA-binding CsgD family transcriptional regulator
MSLTLSNRDLDRLDRVTRALLSPFEDPTLDDWRLRVNREMREFLGADKAAFLLPSVGTLPVLSEEIAPTALEAYVQHYGALDEGFHRQQRMGWGVWSVLMLVEPDRHRKTEIWNDWKAPNHLWGASGISIQVDSTPTAVILYDREEDEAQEERQMALLRLVRPAYEAGIRASVRIGRRHDRLTASVDLLRQAVALTDGSGRVHHCNRALQARLASEPARAAVEAALAEVGRSVGRQRRARSKLWDPRGPAPMTMRITTDAGEYVLSGTLTGIQGSRGRELVLVSVDPPGPRLPAPPELQRDHRLSRREAEIAHAIVSGRTTPQIADALGISLHTARRHSERVFAKLGVHSRVELTRRLLGHGPP